MTDLAGLTEANAKRWESAKLTRDFTGVARRLVAEPAKTRYQAVAAWTKVPWPVIAVIHERECSQDWSKSIAQGDKWNLVSIHVPKRRGPFRSWEDAAIDALTDCPPYAAQNKDWSIGGALTLLEQYNGLGYFARGIPSPYIWSGTDQYKSGKYVRDGFFDPSAVDQQLGCAGLLKAMMVMDQTITFTGAVLTPVPPTPAKPEPLPHPGLGAFILSIIRAIFSLFGRK
jgi:lysozyme family protein